MRIGVPEAEKNEDMELIARHARELGEYFDSVQILVSRHEPEIEDGTINASYGVGNWYSRYGQVRDWLIKADEHIRKNVRQQED